MLVDSHCHLDRLKLDACGGSLDAALENAYEHGVSHLLCVCIDMDNFPDVLKIAHEHRNVFASVGVHPNEREGREPHVDELVAKAGDAQVVAIGETGLDYYYGQGDLDWQRERFRSHIAAAKASSKPLIIHSRDARDDTLRLMREEGAAEVGGVMHCFTEDWDMAKAAMDLNFYISFSGIVTFRNAAVLKEVARRMPADRILVETDSPYLAPVPYRGKPNQPAWVQHVAAHIAELRGEDLEQVAEYTTHNFFTLFSTAKALSESDSPP